MNKGSAMVITDEKKTLFQTIAKKYSNNRETWNFIIGIFGTFLGIFVSIITTIIAPSNFIIAVSVVGCQMMILIMCIITFNSFQKNKQLIENAAKENERIANDMAQEKDDLQTTSDLNKQLINRVLIFSKNINKRINNFLTLICDESDRYYCSVSHIMEKLQAKNNDKDYTDLCKAQIEDERQKYRNSLLGLYNRYIKGVIDETIKVINSELQSKGISLNISLSLKLFDFTYRASADHKKMHIYTAFRDKETYDKKEREIGERHYSIDLNGDFHKCLSHESYIKNNIQNTTEDYLNENFPNCMQYYNCTAVVPIICDYKSDKQIYGFFCCDCLNNEDNCEVFSKNTSDILYSAALTIGIFFDTLNSAWTYIVDDDDEQDFLSYLHKQTYKN